jgi:tRNA1(Val) A37 N6-methylase TrmN6
MSLDHAASLVKQQTLTRDAFLGGRLVVSQPERGFRAGLDSVLLGASVRAGTKRLLDLGAGAGTAALVALADLPEATATLIEIDAETAALAALNLADNGMAGRGRLLVLDVTAKGSMRAAAGLPADHYDTVIANPPFFDPAAGSAPSPARSAARHMPPETLDRWVKAAATHAAPGGEVIFIHVAESLPVLLPAFTARFGSVAVLPLTPRAGEPASRVLIRGSKGSRAPFTLLASRALHEPAGSVAPHPGLAEARGVAAGGRSSFRPEFDAIFRGTARLIW